MRVTAYFPSYSFVDPLEAFSFKKQTNKKPHFSFNKNELDKGLVTLRVEDFKNLSKYKTK